MNYILLMLILLLLLSILFTLKPYGYEKFEDIQYDNIMRFCPDPKYTEFNPAACINNTTLESCVASPIYNHVPDVNQCKNLYDLSINNFENQHYVGLISDLKKYSMEAYRDKSNIIYRNLDDKLKKTHEVACKILKNNSQDFNVDKCLENLENKVDTTEFYNNVSNAYRVCREGKNNNIFNCKLFKDAIDDTSKYGNIVRSQVNKDRTGCKCLDGRTTICYPC